MTETETLAPAELYRRSLRLILDKDIDGWLSLCDENVVFEFPYAPEGYPSRLEGRPAVAAYMRDYPDCIDLREIPALEIHQTRDPRTIVAEWRGTGRIVPTGAAYDMSYVAVVTIDNGRITHYRDYWNPLAVPDSLRDAQSAAPAA